MQSLPIEIVAYIGTLTRSTKDYLSLALVCCHNKGLLTNTQLRGNVIDYFTILTIDHNGIQTWTINGKLHRENDLPAYHSTISQVWYFNGKMHRDVKNGPAYIDVNGIQIYWVHGNWIKYG